MSIRVGLFTLLTGALSMACTGCSRSEQPAGDGNPPTTPAVPSTPARSAAQPAALAGTAWLAETIGGRSIVEQTRVYIHFDAAGRTTGDTGCNSFSGTATFSGENLTFGPLASTRRAGPEPVMDQEHRFLVALGATARWTIDGTGSLHLFGFGGETLLRLTPMPATAPEETGGAAEKKPASDR